MDTKAAFDREAFAKEHGMTMEFVSWFFDKKAAGCGQVWFMMAAAMWEGWKASRAAIEIELPELAVDHDERLRVETSVEGAFNLGVIRSRQAITSHGIRIKGKTE